MRKGSALQRCKRVLTCNQGPNRGAYYTTNVAKILALSLLGYKLSAQAMLACLCPRFARFFKRLPKTVGTNKLIHHAFYPSQGTPEGQGDENSDARSRQCWENHHRQMYHGRRRWYCQSHVGLHHQNHRLPGVCRSIYGDIVVANISVLYEQL